MDRLFDGRHRPQGLKTMARKIIDLKIEHVAGVDRPANKKSFLVIKQEKTEPIDKSVWIESTERYRVTDEDGKFCVYGGDDGRKMGEFDSRKEAIASVIKVQVAKAYVEKEGDKYCLYDDSDKKVGTFDSMAEAKAAMKKSQAKGAVTMPLTKEQIAKVADKEIQDAILKQQEEMLELEKQAKAKDDEIAKLKAAPASDGGDDEAVWKGVPPAVRNRFEAIKRERDEMQQAAKNEKDAREIQSWVGKTQGFKYLQITPEHFGKVMKAVAEHCETEANEIMRVLQTADDLVGKGAIFSEIGKNGHTGKGVADATNMTARVEALAADYMVVDTKLDRTAAIAKVFKEKPDWYPIYAREQQIRV